MSTNGHTNGRHAPVASAQRFRRGQRCPICSGSDDDPRGEGHRCHGFLASDGTWCHCSREEFAGKSAFNPHSQTFPHLLKGRCPCGTEHAPADPEPRKPRTKKGTLDRVYDYRAADGSLVFQVVRYRDPKTFRQRRPDGTLPDGSPRWSWDLQGVDRVLFRMPELAAEPKRLVIVCEGERDCETLEAHGFLATTAPGGAGKWSPSFSAALAGHPIAILPDNDEPGRRHGQMVAASLHEVGCEVRIVELPGLDEHGDPTDWFSHGGTAAQLKKLIREAPPWQPPTGPATAEGDGGDVQVNEAGDDPHRLARIYRDERGRHPEGLTLRFWGGELHEWDGSAYQPVADKELRARLGEVIKSEFDRLNLVEIDAWERRGRADERGKACPKPTARKVTETIKTNAAGNLASLTLVPSRDVPVQPAWLDGAGPWPAAEVLPARNGLVHLPSFVAGAEPCTLPPTPRLFNSYALDYGFDPNAPEPVNWLAFLGAIPPAGRVKLQLWPDDPASIATLQEWFGLNLVADTRYQKMLAMIGPKRSGKGTLARVLRALVGEANVAGPTLSSLATNFGLSPLVGKPTAIIDDARLSGRADGAAILERLLTISGEGTLTVDRKHRDAWTGKLPTRLTIISNELPRLTDASGALAGRLILLRFSRSFYGQEDEALTDTLMGELPGILLWSIAGWARLRDRGHFVQPESGRALVEEMEDLGSPVGAFLKDRCEVGPGREVMAATLYAAWKSWCEEKGRDRPGDEQTFGRNLRAAMPHLTTPSRRLPDGSRKRFYEGIALAPRAESF